MRNRPRASLKTYICGTVCCLAVLLGMTLSVCGERKGLTISRELARDKSAEDNQIEISLHASSRTGEPRIEVRLTNRTTERLRLRIKKLELRSSSKPGLPRVIDSCIKDLDTLDPYMEIRLTVPPSILQDIDPGSHNFVAKVLCVEGEPDSADLVKARGFWVQSKFANFRLGKDGLLVLEQEDAAKKD